MPSGVTFTIGGVAFKEAYRTNDRQALDMSHSDPVQDIKRFHPPGTDGNIVIRSGRVATQFNASMRYLGSLANIYINYNSDRTAWASGSITIIAQDGQTYSTCNLVPGSMRPIAAPRATGRSSGECFLDVQATFTQD